jgi:hypothetical protein
MPPQVDQPPQSRTLLASGAGGFLGAVAGVVAATSLMGNGDEGGSKVSLQLEAEQPQQVAIVEPDAR